MFPFFFVFRIFELTALLFYLRNEEKKGKCYIYFHFGYFYFFAKCISAIYKDKKSRKIILLDLDNQIITDDLV